jgi:AraC-like DNA-binding protein
MEVFYLIGAVQSFFLATLFFSKQKLNTPQRILIGMFIIVGLLLLDHYLELSEVLYQYPHLLGVTYTFPLLLGPALLLYTCLNIRKDSPSIRTFLLVHLWPFTLSNVYLFFSYYLLSAANKLAFYERQTIEASLSILFIEIMLVLSVPIYSVWSIILIQKHKKNIRNEFSYTENVTLKWWKIILICFVLLSLASVVLNIISDGIPLIGYLLADSIIMGGLTIAVFFIGYYGIKQKAIYFQPNEDRTTKSEKLKNVDDSSIQVIIHALEVDKLYLNSTLTLREMAEHLETTENKLSYLINHGFHKSFYDLINEYRVEDVKRLLLDKSYDHLSILGIAFESGFNSKSSFQSVFRKHTGRTPSQFKKKFLMNKSHST